MNATRYILLAAVMVCCFSSGCQRSKTEVWDDTKSASRQVGKGLRSLGGKHGNARPAASREEFSWENEGDRRNKVTYAQPTDYIPLPDEDGDELAMIDCANAMPYDEPGGMNSPIPGIEAFRCAADMPELRGIFKNILFPYNSNLVKGENNLRSIKECAEYMASHPRLYVFVEGHCDERGPEAYNLALGVRRSNAVRELLIKEGADPAKIFTISYGKERPCCPSHDEQAWSLNRRAEYKVYQR